MGVTPTSNDTATAGIDIDYRATNRLVWVVSGLEVPQGYDERDFWYEEKWRSNIIKVPPQGKKRVLMPYLASKKFLAQAVFPAQPFPNGGFINPDTGEVESERFGKPLRMIELTSEERERFDGLSAVQAMAKQRELEAELAGVKHNNDGKAMAVGADKPLEVRKQRGRPPRKVSDEDIQRIDA